MAKQPSTLHKLVHKRFHEVFGGPDITLGRDDHWSLKPSKNSISINILVNGTGEKPAIWVFDPFSKTDGVLRELISNEKELNKVIKQIQQRLKLAGQYYRDA
jgi:hypothetical protein